MFLALVKKDLYIALSTPLAYILCAGYLFLSGFFFFSYLTAFNPFQKITAMTHDAGVSLNTAVILPVYQAQLVILLFIAPLIGMRSVSEERSRNSFELLVSTPLSITTFIIAKWFYLFALIGGVVTLGLVFPLILCLVADPENLPVLLGALGVYLFTGLLCSVCVLFSSLSKNQTIAGILTLIFGLLWFMLDVPFTSQGTDLALFIKSISLSLSTEEFLKGVLYLPTLYFFIASITAFLFLSIQFLSSQSGRL
jgi:ABC-2 type transport system permease protein